MTRLALVLTLVLTGAFLPACERDAKPEASASGAAAASPDPSGSPAATAETTALARRGKAAERALASDRTGNDLYRRSYEQAQNEITRDNAHARLRELERVIDLERQKLK